MPRSPAWRHAVADFVDSARHNPMAVQYLGGRFTPRHVQSYFSVQGGAVEIFGRPQPTWDQCVAMASEVTALLGNGGAIRGAAYDTNLAAEFHVLSLLHRMGYLAHLTLGNKKSVDIHVETPTGRRCTIDVKGLAGTTSWPVDNAMPDTADHHYVFVGYGGAIADPWQEPAVYVVPASLHRSATALHHKALHCFSTSQ